MSIAAALVDGIIIAIRMYRRLSSANLMQRYVVDVNKSERILVLLTKLGD